MMRLYSIKQHNSQSCCKRRCDHQNWKPSFHLWAFLIFKFVKHVSVFFHIVKNIHIHTVILHIHIVMGVYKLISICIHVGIVYSFWKWTVCLGLFWKSGLLWW